jgi:5-(carboxyamino)imidazole ribonucleotide mutase
LATVQMPSGIPVATVAIDGARNAALLAAEIIAVSDAGLAEKLAEYRANLAKLVEPMGPVDAEALRKERKQRK